MSALAVHVVVVGGPGEEVAEQLAEAGYTVSGPASCEATAAAVAGAVKEAPGADVVVVVGGCGPRGVFPEALQVLGARTLPGFGEEVRSLAREILQASAWGLRVGAGFAGERLAVGLPAHAEVAHEAVARVLLPALPLLFPQEGWSADEEAPPAVAAPAPATPTRSVGLEMAEAVEDVVQESSEEGVPARGWQAAVRALNAEVQLGRREDLPEPIENLAPVVNVLHTAGEVGTMRLPSGRRYGLYGWPDLRRPGSKVIAVSWGDPLAELVVLHRHPHPVGTTIDGDLGLLPPSDSDVADAAIRATGRPPPDPSGKLFALESDAIWILRGRRVYKWDGRRERDDGNPKQVLASLTLRWSNH